MKTSLWSATLIASSLASPAIAETVSYSLTSNIVTDINDLATVSVPLFDAALGTLTDLSFDYAMEAQATFFLFPGNAASGNASANTDFAWFQASTFGPFGPTGAGGGLPVLTAVDGDAFSSPDITTYAQSLFGTDAASMTAPINGWTGTGTGVINFRLAAGAFVATSNEVFFDFRDVVFSMDLQVNYTFDPVPAAAVPLPAGLPLALLGLAALFGVGSRRSRKILS